MTEKYFQTSLVVRGDTVLHPLLSGKLHNNDKWPQDKLPYRRHIIQETETGKRDKCTSMYFIENHQAIASFSSP